MSEPPRRTRPPGSQPPGAPEAPINAPRNPPRPAGGGRPQVPDPGRKPASAPSRQPQGQPGRPGQTPPPTSRQPAGTARQQVPPRGVPPRTTGSYGRPPAAQQRQPIDLATRLDGQRGWLAQIDESLKKRSIIALVLTCLAVGVGAAAIYISLTKNADGDRIDALQSRVEALEAAAGIPPEGTEVIPPETTVPEATIPETGTTLPDTGTTLPDGTTDPGTAIPLPTD